MGGRENGQLSVKPLFKVLEHVPSVFSSKNHLAVQATT